MSKQPSHHRQPWTRNETAQVRQLAAGNTPTRIIALKLERTPDAVRSQAAGRHISLKPWNQRPYGRSGK
jgi:hypothetical protein